MVQLRVNTKMCGESSLKVYIRSDK